MNYEQRSSFIAGSTEEVDYIAKIINEE